ncbi:spore cortex biosynthesis protein YabQ [Caminicella sporogenes DSM 14501]|uniref:Spore cortex biosynthesis protein YabQ n=1 Tax=Caminicella sporogenes DSM 14501 TaxID=1121266 RepID=A0A1M6QST9_9FIRM|nr:spore cortex biosynthesis protein YabQ [Caminicella sporogenes]RKD20924.1 hypothetical protein BET04_08830 [Caminicella sporogenes]WIF95668.1 spore cortex biosynthesis protein YabQ [Caminicella sporogenes]SHK23284.1 spore cortex biosynthesis protein YabQ [Caminicella sporogenes DSM 14501]
MTSFVYYQIYVFFATLYGGILIGFIYDIYKIFRFYLKPKRITAILQDLFFWITITMVAILVLLYSDDGRVRGYTLLGFILGTSLYNIFLSRLFTKMFMEIIVFIKRVFSCIYNKVNSIVIFIIRIIKYPCIRVVQMLRPYCLRLKRISLIPKRMFKDIKKNMSTIIHKKK